MATLEGDSMPTQLENPKQCLRKGSQDKGRQEEGGKKWQWPSTRRGLSEEPHRVQEILTRACEVSTTKAPRSEALSLIQGPEVVNR